MVNENHENAKKNSVWWDSEGYMTDMKAADVFEENAGN